MFILSILFHIVSYDLWFYISHVALHKIRNPIIKDIHSIHHEVPHENLKWNNTSDGHIIEHIIQPLGIFIPCLFFIDINGLILSSLYISIRGCMRHDHRCSWMIGEHHLLHHKYPEYNYSEYYIDYIFGTICPKKISSE